MAAATPPRSTYSNQRTRSARDARPRAAGRHQPDAAFSATAGTAPPAPAAAPRIHGAGWGARKTADKQRMAASPGTMKHSPPITAPAFPRRRQAQRMANCVEDGPGRRLATATPSSNSVAVIHRLSSTQSRRNSAMWWEAPRTPDIRSVPTPGRWWRETPRAAVPRPESGIGEIAARCCWTRPRSPDASTPVAVVSGSMRPAERLMALVCAVAMLGAVLAFGVPASAAAKGPHTATAPVGATARRPWRRCDPCPTRSTASRWTTSPT